MIVTIFRSRLRAQSQEEYGAVAARMSALAREVPGYVSHKGFVAEDGERVTIVEFASEAALRAWQTDPAHLAAKKLGFTTFFESFSYQICTVGHARAWVSRTAEGGGACKPTT
jgi:heme-degrading monooxygenase HmoA